MALRIRKAHFDYEVVVPGRRQWLRHYVGDVFGAGDMSDFKVAVLDSFADVVMADVDVFDS